MAPDRLLELERIDLPVPEASGLAITTGADGRQRVLVVGDWAPVVAVAPLEDGRPTTWELVNLSSLSGWDLPATDSQFEAIACDGAATVALLREDPANVLLADTRQRRLVATVRLVVPESSPLHSTWRDRSSRGEGLVLLNNGHLLVAKEKKPAALVEFGPAGSVAGGVRPELLIGPGDAFPLPDGDTDFQALAYWRLRGEAKRTLADISAMAVGPERGLWLLSDTSAAVGRVDLSAPLDPKQDRIESLAEAWRLPRGTKKPEGLCLLAEGEVLVALDLPGTQGNGLIVTKPALQPEPAVHEPAPAAAVQLLDAPTRVPVPGGKTIDEYVGVASTGAEAVSVARMSAPAGWTEPAQRPAFDEVTVVLSGSVRLEHLLEDEPPCTLEVLAGQAVLTRAGARVRYAVGEEGAEYVAICLPAFTEERAGRETPEA